MSHEKAHPPAPTPAPSAASGAREEGGVSHMPEGFWPLRVAGPAPAPAVKDPLTTRPRPSRPTEIIALDLVTGNQAQIMDMLGRDPMGAPDEAWDRAAELLLESMHGCVTVLTARRNRADDNRLRPLVTATIRPDETLAQYAARALGYPA